MAHKMLVEKVDRDGTTGHRTYWCRVIELNDAGEEVGRGRLFGYGVDARAFANLHEASAEKFIEAQRADAIELYERIKVADAAEQTIAGTML